MKKHCCGFAMERHRSTMPHRIALVWLISFATLVTGGCVGNPFLHTSTKADLDTFKPLKPLPIEEWTDPHDQEIARRLIAIKEHQQILGSLIRDLWDAKPTANRADREGSTALTTDSANWLPISGEMDQLPSLEQTFSQLHRKLNQFIWYPPVAIKNGWEGVVLIDVLVRDNGEFVTARVATSSGYSVLDHSAIETVRQACPLDLKKPFERPATMVRVPVRYLLSR